MEKLRQKWVITCPRPKRGNDWSAPLLKFAHMSPQDEVKARQVVCVVGEIRGHKPGQEAARSR